MPGIVGFCGIDDQEGADSLMQALVRSMRDEESYEIEIYSGPGIGLARLHLGIIDHDPQPLWSDDGNIALVMTGEIYSWDQLKLRHPVTGKEPGFSNARLLLAAYQQYGAACVQHINGSFAAAIWNAAENTLLLINDHIGTHPLYFAHVHDRLVFGSGARAAAQAPGLQRSVDLAALAEMIAFGQVFGDRTLFAGVHLLLPGTVLRFQDGVVSLTQYVDWQHPEHYEIHGEEYYIERWIYYMRQAVMRQARPPEPVGVLLTGGLDSRSILGMLHEAPIDLVTRTFGIPKCNDIRWAQEIARFLNVPHLTVQLQPDYLARLGAKGVRMTDGMKGCVHFNVLGPLSQLVQGTRVLYKGYLGGTIYGYVVSHGRLAPVRENEWFEQVFGVRNRVFAEGVLPQLYTAEMARSVCDVPRQSLRQALARSRSTWWVDKDSYVDLYENDVRFTSLGVELARSQAVVRSPLADQDLLRFTRSVPPGFRVDNRYYQHALVKAFPQLSKIPTTATGLPINRDCFRYLGMRAREQMRWWLRDHGLGVIPTPKPRPYADYANWMRHELRSWVEGTLLSVPALERGYFQPATIRRLVTEHMEGYDHTEGLGVLLSLELWHQQYMD